MIVPGEYLRIVLNDRDILGVSELDIPDSIELTDRVGHSVSMTLRPNAPSLPFLLEVSSIIAGGGAVNFGGSVKDAARRYSIRLAHGSMTDAPLGALLDDDTGKTFTFKFESLYLE